LRPLTILAAVLVRAVMVVSCLKNDDGWWIADYCNLASAD
jgi:hypothetical protein